MRRLIIAIAVLLAIHATAVGALELFSLTDNALWPPFAMGGAAPGTPTSTIQLGDTGIIPLGNDGVVSLGE